MMPMIATITSNTKMRMAYSIDRSYSLCFQQPLSQQQRNRHAFVKNGIPVAVGELPANELGAGLYRRRQSPRLGLVDAFWNCRQSAIRSQLQIESTTSRAHNLKFVVFNFQFAMLGLAWPGRYRSRF